MTHADCFFFERGGCDGQLKRAHLIPKQVICRELGFPRQSILRTRLQQAVVWDERVWRPACELHHHRLDYSRTVKLLRRELPESVEEYAAEYGLVWWLEREYGPLEARAVA